MRGMMSRVQRFLISEDGPTAVEYAVMLALILVAAIVTTLGKSISNTFNSVNTSLGFLILEVGAAGFPSAVHLLSHNSVSREPRVEQREDSRGFTLCASVPRVRRGRRGREARVAGRPDLTLTKMRPKLLVDGSAGEPARHRPGVEPRSGGIWNRGVDDD